MHHGHPGQESGVPELHGSWELIEAEFTCAATHAALLPTNKVFVYGGSSLDRDAFQDPPPAEILDLNVDPPVSYKVPSEVVEGDVWCGGHTFLPDGKLLFVGGTSFYPPPSDPLYGGLKEAYTFDPFTETWERLDDMEKGRWYPTLVRLADDRVLAVSGLEYRDPDQEPPDKSTITILWELLTKISERIVDAHEVFDPVQRKWGTLAEEKAFPLYPRLHLLPDGDVFYSGVFNTHYFVPGRFPSARFNPSTERWTALGGRHKAKNREEGISTLLALRPPDYPARVLIAGGGQHNLGRIVMSLLHSIGKDSWAEKLHFLLKIQDSAELIDLSQRAPAWETIGKMSKPRVHANGVLLPDGQVLVVGGMSGYGNIPGTHMTRFPVLEAEMYDPGTHEWAKMAAQQMPRVYHSSAILLPDGRVISMGSNPHAKMIEESIEIFSPPYLFRGSRPAILECPEQLAHGQAFNLRVDEASQIDQVVLMRPEVVTHVTNTDQRLLELEFNGADGETLEVQGPPTPAHMPRGYCLLFVLDDEGVPSVGKFVKVA